MSEKISYYQERDFGATFNISVKFIRENFRVLISALTFIAGPFILLSAIATVLYENSIAEAAGGLFRDGRFHFFDLINYQYGISYLVSSLANLVLTATVFEVMKLYAQMPASEITVGKVGKALLNDFGRLFGTMLFFFLIIVMVLVVCGGIAIGFSSAHWGFAVLAIFLLLIVLLLAAPNMLYLISTTYLVRVMEPLSVTESLSRARYGMRGNYWWTWLMMLCLFLIIMIISVAVSVPSTALTFIFGTTHMDVREYSLLFQILSVATKTLYILFSSFVFVIMAFHHFSLIENKEGTGLLARIDEIGQKPKHETAQDY